MELNSITDFKIIVLPMVFTGGPVMDAAKLRRFLRVSAYETYYSYTTEEYILNEIGL